MTIWSSESERLQLEEESGMSLKRKDLKPWLRPFPKWVLVTLVILAGPIYVIWGGLREGPDDWFNELEALRDLDS